MKDEFFGSDDQRALLRRGRALAALLGQDRRYSYDGRSVGLPGPEDGDIDQLAALAVVQGSATYGTVPLDQTETIKAAMVARGLVPMLYDEVGGFSLCRRGGTTGCRDCFPARGPDDAASGCVLSGWQLASLAEMALGCGVLPPCGEVLRGLLRPAVCLVAVDRAANVVSCAASSAYAHEDHPRQGGQAWWGMLATDPVRRGQRLSLFWGQRLCLRWKPGSDLATS